MRAIAILLLVGAAAASPTAVEEVHEQIRPEMRLLSIFGVPKFHRDFILPQEKFGVKSLHDKPFVVAIKNEDKNEVTAFLLRGGLNTLYNYPEFQFLRDLMLTGPKKVGIMLSAARYLDLPEMSMPINKIVVPHDFTMASEFRISQDGFVMPWLFLTNMDDLRLGSLDKLMEIGIFNMTPEKVLVARDLLIDNIETKNMFYPFVTDETLLEHDDKFLPYQRVFTKPIVRVLNDKYTFPIQRTVVPQNFETYRHNPILYTNNPFVQVY